MVSREDLARFTDKRDAHTLNEVVRVIRRRRITFDGISRASVCRVLANEALTITRSIDERPSA